MQCDYVWKVLITPPFIYERLHNPHLGRCDVNIHMLYMSVLMKHKPFPYTHVSPQSRKQITKLGE